MAEVVCERERFREVLIEAESAGERARDLYDFQRMGEPRPVVVALVIDEHLRLMREAAEGGRMDDSVTIATEVVAGGAGRLAEPASAALRRVGRERSEEHTSELQSPV